MMSATKDYFKKALTVLLTLGASILLGLLSFGGMYVLLPLLGVSIAAFVLSVIYEGEIYQKNISNALDKLLNRNFTAQILGEEFLKNFDFTQDKLPEFFKTYQQLSSLPPTPARNKRLKTMETWLGQLLSGKPDASDYAQAVMDCVGEDTIRLYTEKAQQVSAYHSYIQIFSAIAAGLMVLGTIFLILEVLPVLPFISLAPTVLPFVVIPMASIAGIAYGFLSYNSLTDFLLKNNFKSWWEDIKKQATGETRNWKNIAFVSFSVFIFALNLTLTLCTAGTWWTVVNGAQTTWRWLKHPLTKVATALIAPVVSISTLGFNLQNTIETINEVKEALDSPPEEPSTKKIQRSTETWAQIFNPFRFLLKLTFTPLLILFFLGHLISIGLTSDRMPGIPAIVSALLGMLSELFEDFHYFFDLKSLIKPFVIFFKIVFSPILALVYLAKSLWKILTQDDTAPNTKTLLKNLSEIFSEGFIEAFSTSEESSSACTEITSTGCCPSGHQHDHGTDHHHEHSALPNQILELAFSPLFALAALWHWAFQDPKSSQQKTYQECFYLQIGWQIEDPKKDLEQVEKNTDSTWLKVESLFALQEQIQTLDQEWIQKDLAIKKKQDLETLHQKLSHPEATSESVKEAYTEAMQTRLKTQRFFKVSEKTTSQALVEEILSNTAIFTQAKPKVSEETTSQASVSNEASLTLPPNTHQCTEPNCRANRRFNFIDAINKSKRRNQQPKVDETTAANKIIPTCAPCTTLATNP
jgi:hypothetical protein